MCVAMTYLHTPLIEALITQLEEVGQSITSIIQEHRLLSPRFVRVPNGMHVVLPSSSCKT